MTPVIFLSDGYIANGAEPWKFPQTKDLPVFKAVFQRAPNQGDQFLPYLRDDKLVRGWAIPGTPGLEHRIGGLEKQDKTGNVSYDPDNHQQMVLIRQAKVDMIAHHIPEQDIDNGDASGKLLVLGWGSTYGVIKTAVAEWRSKGAMVSHAHLRYLRPFPKNLGQLLRSFETILVPELNNGQLVKIIRDQYLVDAKAFNKIKGIPITRLEMMEEIGKYV
jgi:2-oxoglutarate ferredoxin oxidoreductase subunit alpha